MNFPSIQIHQTYAQIGIQAGRAIVEQRQSPATFNLEQTPAKLSIKQPNGTLHIDQSKAWDALARAGVTVVMDRIHDQARSVAMNGIARIVDKGNRMAAIHLGGNAIAELAKDVRVSFPEFDYVGEASCDNVDIYYEANKPIINVELGGVRLQTFPTAPELHYQRGKLDIYMQQYGSVEITPPSLDILV